MLRERHKAIAIPLSQVNNVPHFLVVHDRRYKEWTFVTGGCRRREIYNPIRCALRELEEETRGLLNLKGGSYSHFKFTNNLAEQRDIEDGVDVLNHYHVYVLNLPMTQLEHSNFVTKFIDERNKMDNHQIPFRKNYDENDDCMFGTLQSIVELPNVWTMIRNQVINNPAFKTSILMDNWIPFNLKD